MRISISWKGGNQPAASSSRCVSTASVGLRVGACQKPRTPQGGRGGPRRWLSKVGQPYGKTYPLRGSCGPSNRKPKWLETEKFYTMANKKSNHKALSFMRGVLGATAWTSAVKGGRQLIAHLNRLGRLVTGSFSNGFVRVNCSVAFHLAAIYRNQGAPGVVKRLKVSQVLMMQALAGRPHQSAQKVGVAIARASNGLPRLIPAVHRRRLRSDPGLVRWWMTIFGLYRVIEIPHVAKIQTILDPSTMKAKVREDIKEFIPVFLSRAPFKFGKFEDTIVKPLLLCTSSPNVMRQGISLWSSSVAARAVVLLGQRGIYTTIRLLLEAMGKCNQGNTVAAKKNTDWWYHVWCLGQTPFAIRLSESGETRIIGRLEVKREPAGKARVFAMVDYFTQVVLRPLHDQIYRCLVRIPQDGLFEQHRPIKVLASRVRQGALQTIHSIDLSAATDRFPLAVQIDLLAALTNDSYAQAWAQTLVGRAYYPSEGLYKLLGLTGEAPGYHYGAGQPMGAYSSWAMFALAHHLVVQMAADRAGFRKWFGSYALLGDDLVIAHPKVAKEYYILAEALGVTVSASKSLRSRNGSFEFAKRFILKGEDVSPTSWKEYDVAIRHMPSLIEMVRDLGSQAKMRVSDVLFALGHGYRSVGRANARWSKLGGRVRGALVLLRSPKSPFGVASWQEWFSLVTPVVGRAMSEPEKARATQSLYDRYDNRLLELLRMRIPKALARVQLSIFKDYCGSRDWITKGVPPQLDPSHKAGRPAAMSLPGAKLWVDLIAAPVLATYGVKLRNIVIKLAMKSQDVSEWVLRDLWSFVGNLKDLNLRKEDFEVYMEDALHVEGELGLLVSANRLSFTERASPSSLIDKSSGKLLRLFKAIRKAAGRLHLEPIKDHSNRTRSPKGGPKSKTLRKLEMRADRNRQS